MRANEFITEQVEEGIGADMLWALLPEKLQMWLQKQLQKGQYDALSRVYDEIMHDEINPPENPKDALFRAAKTVGLDPRIIYDMFGDAGIPPEGLPNES
jgi:hypothetical protein